MTLPEGWTTAELLDAAIDEKVVFVPGASFSFESPERLAEGQGGWGWRWGASLPDQVARGTIDTSTRSRLG